MVGAPNGAVAVIAMREGGEVVVDDTESSTRIFFFGCMW